MGQERRKNFRIAWNLPGTIDAGDGAVRARARGAAAAAPRAPDDPRRQGSTSLRPAAPAGPGAREPGARSLAFSPPGQPISAGARVAHVKAAAEAGRSVQLDLSDVPAELRPALLVEIRELIREHAARAARSRQVEPVAQSGDKPVANG